jgi:hypothetical protein
MADVTKFLRLAHQRIERGVGLARLSLRRLEESGRIIHRSNWCVSESLTRLLEMDARDETRLFLVDISNPAMC